MPKSGTPANYALIVEDHPLVADSLAACISDCDALLAVKTAESLGAALRILASQREPALITTDLTLPDSQGTESIRRLREAAPTSRLLVFTALDDSRLRQEASDLGAMDYLLKSSSAQTLRNKLRMALRGCGPAPQPASASIKLAGRPDKPNKLSPLLTLKQQTVLEELVAGRSNKEIAARMNISPETVSSHMKGVFGRLCVRNRTEAVVRYLELIA